MKIEILKERAIMSTCPVSFFFCIFFAVTSDLNLKVICLQAPGRETDKVLTFLREYLSEALLLPLSSD